MPPNPERTYILARPWLDYSEGTIATGFPDKSDDELAVVLSGLGARWILQTFGKLDEKNPASDDATEKFLRTLVTWARETPAVDAKVVESLDAGFVKRVGMQHLVCATVDARLPRFPHWIVMHAVKSPEHAHAVLQCITKEAPGKFDVELMRVSQRDLEVPVWANLEAGIRDFDTLHRDWSASIATEHILNPIKQLRKRILGWAKIIDEGFVPSDESDPDDGENEIAEENPAVEHPLPPAAAAPVAHPAATGISAGFCAPSELATRLNVGHDRLRKQLERARRSGEIPDGAWFEVTERKPRSPKFFYSEAAVRAFVANSPLSSESSSERPAKRNPKN